jgi:hypothetical protein
MGGIVLGHNLLRGDKAANSAPGIAIAVKVNVAIHGSVSKVII